MLWLARAVVLPMLCVMTIAALADVPDEPPAPTREAYIAWIVGDPTRADEVRAFERYLRRERVGGIFPTFQILRSESSWQRCHGEPFALAPRSNWRNIVATLRFIRDRVRPVTGPLEIMSGYRDPALNACAGGAPKSAHQAFWALDLEPTGKVTREKMIARLCRVHSLHGASANVGLGFYEGRRFHIDSMGLRLWGADHHAATSPCMASPV